MNQRRIRALIGLAITVLMILPVILGVRPELIARFEGDLYDVRLKSHLKDDIDPSVVIVDVDEASLAALGRWPWSRDVLAQMVHRLVNEYGAAVVGFDMLFSEADDRIAMASLQDWLAQVPNANGQDLVAFAQAQHPDQRFAQAIDPYAVVLGYVFESFKKAEPVGDLGRSVVASPELLAASPIPKAQSYIGNLAELQGATPWAGFFDNPLVDADGVFRRVPLLQAYQGNYYPSLSLAVLMALFGEQQVTPIIETDITGQLSALTALELAGMRIPVSEQGALLVPYRGPQGSYPYVSAVDVIEGRADPALLEGAVVLVGTSAAGLLDLRVTPMSNTYAGVEVHANVVAGILDERVLSQPDYTRALELLQMLVCGLLMSLLLPRLGAIWGSVLTLLLVALVVGFNLYAWQALLWVIPLGYTLVLVVILFLFEQITGFFFETRNRSQLAAVFGQYIPPEIVDELNTQGAKAQLEGESRDLTVFFSDVRGFTGLSETLTPQQLTKLMNTYLTTMTEIIHDHKGTIDKYIGDAVMAFWGAPLEDENHPRHALQAAMAMQAALKNVNAELTAMGLPPVAVGMGLNCGEMNVGNMGSSFRMAYTVLGDAVNLGSRLEGLTKFYGVGIIVSGELAERLPEYQFLSLDLARVKGRNEPVELLQPLGLRESLSPALAAQVAIANAMVLAYRAGDFNKAAQQLGLLEPDQLGEGFCQLYQQRIDEALARPSDLPWDGVYSHTSK